MFQLTLNIIGHFDKASQIFVQFDYMSKLTNNQIGYSTKLNGQNIHMSFKPLAFNQNVHVH
jgi:hypothetical protein